MAGDRSSASKFLRDFISFISANPFISFNLFVLALYRLRCFQARKKKFNTKGIVNYETFTTFSAKSTLLKIDLKYL